jgi:hypothetical protein
LWPRGFDYVVRGRYFIFYFFKKREKGGPKLRRYFLPVEEERVDKVDDGSPHEPRQVRVVCQARQRRVARKRALEPLNVKGFV